MLFKIDLTWYFCKEILRYLARDHVVGENTQVGLKRNIKLEFHSVKVTSGGELLAYRGLEDASGLFNSISTFLAISEPVTISGIIYSLFFTSTNL